MARKELMDKLSIYIPQPKQDRCLLSERSSREPANGGRNTFKVEDSAGIICTLPQAMREDDF